MLPQIGALEDIAVAGEDLVARQIQLVGGAVPQVGLGEQLRRACGEHVLGTLRGPGELRLTSLDERDVRLLDLVEQAP